MNRFRNAPSDPGELGPDHVVEASRLIRRHIRTTPLLPAPELTDRIGRPVWIKHEQLQETGSFKLRGAAHFLVRLAAEMDPSTHPGVVACSSGNHGRAVASMARTLDFRATLCVPGWVDPVKLHAMEEAGARVLRIGETYDAAEEEALRLAASEGLRFVPPFDDPWIVAGQGTVALEVLDRLKEAGADGPTPREPGDRPVGAMHGDFLVPLSGGGLAAGCMVALRGSRVRTVGVGVDHAPVMIRSLAAGRPLTGVEEHGTLASALSGGIGSPNRWTYPLLEAGSGEGRFFPMEVSERAVREGVEFALTRLKTLVEGGGAAALAALLSEGRDSPGLPKPLRDGSGPLVVVLSGGNLDPSRLRKLLDRREARS